MKIHGLHQLTLLTLLYPVTLYKPLMNVTLLGSQHCESGFIEGDDQIIYNVIIDLTQSRESDWKKEVIVLNKGSEFCVIGISQANCPEVAAVKSDQCYCSQVQQTVFTVIVNFTANYMYEGNQFNFFIYRTDNLDYVKDSELLPHIFREPEMTVTIDDQPIRFDPDCRQRLNSGRPHKLDVCTVNLNNPDVQVKILESDDEPRKFTTSCDSSELEISEGNNSFEVVYSDDCKRRGTKKCILEGYANVTGTKKTCEDCDEEDEATDWFFVLKWLLPTVVVVASVSTLIIIIIKVKEAKEQRALLSTISSHRTLGASRSHLSAGRSRSGLSLSGSRSKLSVKGSRSQLGAKGSASQVGPKKSQTLAHSSGSSKSNMSQNDSSKTAET